ncbi:MAG: Energy-coupling factor transporter ATP-binding protein EcfA [Firmicutes bacterium]|nr:Energy-coupling factor transporter ATP-binding protein EcfA [Bacillota bacterium]
MAGTPYENIALEGINLEIEEGSFIGIIGHTGSGKSTLIQHLNGLLKPQKGTIEVDGEDIWEKGYKRSKVRQKVGLVFQYPEHQIFEETVYKDIAFGPRNIGMAEEDVMEQVKWAMKMVALDFDELKDISPFDLSGGQRRRIAIAGVLAMDPKYLVLDEPTAGLDPRGRREILAHIYSMYRDRGITIILVSHNMDEVARLADKIIVMEKGSISLSGTPEEVFREGGRLREKGLALPAITSLMTRLKENGWPVRSNVFTADEAEREILKVLRGNGDA